jgi:hypothetical protein
MSRLELGMIVRHDGRLAEVESIADGRTIGLRYLDATQDRCAQCGQRTDRRDLLEHAPLLQDHLEPVVTIGSVAP